MKGIQGVLKSPETKWISDVTICTCMLLKLGFVTLTAHIRPGKVIALKVEAQLNLLTSK